MPENDRPTLIPTGDEPEAYAAHDTEPAPPPDFDDTEVDAHEVHLFV